MKAWFPVSISLLKVKVRFLESKSTCFPLTTSNLLLCETGINLTLLESLRTAAAIALQKSTSIPIH
jgi:hypothetical protein